MTQHDFTIENQGFPAFRSDMNNALLALVSNSSGATEPTTTSAYQFWYDTTANVLKIRNAANNGWIALAIFDQATNTFSFSDIDIDNINISGNTISSSNTNGNIALTPDGSGEVDITKVDIDSGNIDGTVVGASSAAAGTFTSVLSNNGDISANGFKFFRQFSSTLSYGAEFQLGSISAYEGSWFLISCWNNSGGNGQDGAGIACTGDNGRTLLLSQTGVMNISTSHNWGSPPSGYCLVGREASGNKLVVKNTISGVTLQVRLLRLI